MWSFSDSFGKELIEKEFVLILVLLGCGLLVVANIGRRKSHRRVLILVLLGCGLLDYETRN